MIDSGAAVADDFADLPWLADGEPPFDPSLDRVLPLPGCLAPQSLSDDGRIDALAALAKLRARTEAHIVQLLAAMTPEPTSPADREWIRDEIGVVLRESPVAVRWRITVARELTSRLPETLALVEDGQLSARHAETLAESVWALPDAVAAQVQRQVLPRAPLQTVAAFRRSIRRAIAKADTRTHEEQHESALAERRVVATDVGNGMGTLWAMLPITDIAAIMERVRYLAAKLPGEPGNPHSLDHRRADVLVDMLLGRVDEDAVALAPSIQVTIAASTLFGLDDQPAELDGWGPIPATLARAVAFDPTGTMRRLLTDPASGKLLDYGRTTYEPPVALADHVKTRDRTCRFPGCTRRARSCHLDHLHAWEDGGETSRSNCECLCSRHHHAKHEGGWTVRGDPEGELTWTSPTNHTYRSPPAME